MKIPIDFTLSNITLTSANYTLTDYEAETYRYLKVAAGSNTYAIIAPNEKNYNFIVINDDYVNDATIKVSGQTGVTVQESTSKRVRCNGTDYEEYGVLIPVIASYSPSSSPSSSTSPSSSVSASISSSPSA